MVNKKVLEFFYGDMMHKNKKMDEFEEIGYCAYVFSVVYGVVGCFRKTIKDRGLKAGDGGYDFFYEVAVAMAKGATVGSITLDLLHRDFEEEYEGEYEEACDFIRQETEVFFDELLRLEEEKPWKKRPEEEQEDYYGVCLLSIVIQRGVNHNPDSDFSIQRIKDKKGDWKGFNLLKKKKKA